MKEITKKISWNKKAYFFSLDAFVALVIILGVIFFIKSNTVQISYEENLQRDLLEVLSSIKIGEINNSYVRQLIANGNITNLNQSVLEQIGEFYAESSSEAGILTENILNELNLEENLGLYFNGMPVALSNSTGINNSEKLWTSRQIISGIQQGNSSSGFSSRAFLTARNKVDYFYFGGYVGDGNISVRVGGNITNVNIEAVFSGNFDLYINNISAGSYTPPSDIPYKISLTNYTSLFSSEENYIDFNTNMRTKAKTNFEKDIFKLLNNAFYGKTVENIRGRINVNLVSDFNSLKRITSRVNFKGGQIIDHNLALLTSNITSITFNKPIYLGASILDLSKLLMYEFFYNTILPTWNKVEVIGFDTDSYFLNIKTEDVYEDMKKIQNELDTSDFPENHFLFNKDNKKVIGKFKDELNGKMMTEIIFLKSKCYSYKVFGNEYYDSNLKTRKCKGISKVTNKKYLTFDDYKKALFDSEIIIKSQYQINSKQHNIYFSKITKRALSCFDNKRFIFTDGIRTLPYCKEQLKLLQYLYL